MRSADEFAEEVGSVKGPATKTELFLKLLAKYLFFDKFVAIFGKKYDSFILKKCFCQNSFPAILRKKKEQKRILGSHLRFCFFPGPIIGGIV